MGLNDIALKKTAILFFDILNGYYHAAEGAAKARMKPKLGVRSWILAFLPKHYVVMYG